MTKVVLVLRDGSEMLRYKNLTEENARAAAEDLMGTGQFRQVKVVCQKTGEYIAIYPLPG